MSERKSLRQLLAEMRVVEKPPYRVVSTNLPQACLDKLAAWTERAETSKSTEAAERAVLNERTVRP